MNEREMLELAAKAAGYSLTRGSKGYREFLCKAGVEWNPLTDDGDALRLAVKIGADIQPKGTCVEVWIYESRASSGIVYYGDNPYAATRLAITRAAAEIGRSMQ